MDQHQQRAVAHLKGRLEKERGTLDARKKSVSKYLPLFCEALTAPVTPHPFGRKKYRVISRGNVVGCVVESTEQAVSLLQAVNNTAIQTSIFVALPCTG